MNGLNLLKLKRTGQKNNLFLKKSIQNKKIFIQNTKFFITIGYSWSTERDFSNQNDYPEESGVYRLKKDGEIVRIGESSNIATRLKEHYSTYDTEVDKFDFEVVPNDDERKKEEKRLLEHFKDTIGRLPRLNPITN